MLPRSFVTHLIESNPSKDSIDGTYVHSSKARVKLNVMHEFISSDMMSLRFRLSHLTETIVLARYIRGRRLRVGIVLGELGIVTSTMCQIRRAISYQAS